MAGKDDVSRPEISPVEWGRAIERADSDRKKLDTLISDHHSLSRTVVELGERIDHQHRQLSEQIRDGFDQAGRERRKLFAEQDRQAKRWSRHLQAHGEDPRNHGEQAGAWDPKDYDPNIANERTQLSHNRWRVLGLLVFLVGIALGGQKALPWLRGLLGVLP